MIDQAALLSRRAQTLGSNPIQDLFTRFQNEGELISFAAGAPDPTLLPVDLLGELTQTAIDRYGPRLLQYGSVRGFPPLIDALIRPLRRSTGVCATHERVHISTGATGALYTLCAALLDPGDTVLVAEPSYGVESGLFTSFGARVVGVACDQQGILPDALDAALRAGSVRLVYLMATFANPTGATMSTQRRQDLAAVITTHDVLVVEDDAYSRLRYHGHHLRALHHHAPEHTVYIGSLSKILAPAVRIGYTIAPSPVIDAMLRVKPIIDLQTSTLTQALAAVYLSTRPYEQTSRLRPIYAARLQATCHALETNPVPGFWWQRPDGGMFLWLQGPPTFNAAATLEQAANAGVLYLPGHHFYTDPQSGANTIRLAFATIAEQRIADGIRRLSVVLARASSHRRS